MRIALFGGTFDPIHEAHLKIAREAGRQFHLDRVLLIPAARPPHKEGVTRTSYEHRFRMVEIACQREPLCQTSRLDEGGRAIPSRPYSARAACARTISYFS